MGVGDGHRECIGCIGAFDRRPRQQHFEHRLDLRLLRRAGADDGEVVAVSEWDDEASALAWRLVAEHRTAQQRGRTDYYQEYTLFACAEPRVHRFERKDEA